MIRKQEFCNIGKRVKCIDSAWRNYDNCIAYCNNQCHKGYVTKKLLAEHKCIERKCSFLDPMRDHPYWIAKEDKKNRKAEINKKNKDNKHTENAILKKANKIMPESSEAILCRHLFDSTYILIIISSSPIEDFSEKLNSIFKVDIHIKQINESKRKNIKYTYLSLLDESMREKVKKLKMTK